MCRLNVSLNRIPFKWAYGFLHNQQMSKCKILIPKPLKPKPKTLDPMNLLTTYNYKSHGIFNKEP